MSEKFAIPDEEPPFFVNSSIVDTIDIDSGIPSQCHMQLANDLKRVNHRQRLLSMNYITAIVQVVFCNLTSIIRKQLAL